MNCERFGASLHDWLQDALEAAQRAEFDRHLAACEPCRRRAARHREFCCRKFAQALDGYLEGELRPGHVELFEVHLRFCVPCVDYLESYRLTIELARRSRGGEAGPDCGELPAELLRAILEQLKRSE